MRRGKISQITPEDGKHVFLRKTPEAAAPLVSLEKNVNEFSQYTLAGRKKKLSFAICQSRSITICAWKKQGICDKADNVLITIAQRRYLILSSGNKQNNCRSFVRAFTLCLFFFFLQLASQMFH
jgi:hypothetical protein